MSVPENSPLSSSRPGKDPLIFTCFQTRVRKDGKTILIGCEESAQIKYAHVWRGFLTKSGKPRKKLSWLEQLVVQLRSATSEPEYDHEWWGAEISKPLWVQNLDKKSEFHWLHFPGNTSDLTISVIGRRLGYALTITEARMNAATANPEYLRSWEHTELEQACRNFEEEDATKVQLAIPGYDSFRQFAQDRLAQTKAFREEIMGFVESQGLHEALEFREAFNSGAKRALSVNIENPTSDFDRRAETFRILSEYWDRICGFTNRAELCLFIARNFPPKARQILESARETVKKDTGQWRNFTEFVRDICDELGLKLAGRGRPRKNTENSLE